MLIVVPRYNNILEQYLREAYPNYKYILSTTSITRGVDKINSMCDKYDYVVVSFEGNEDLINYLKNIGGDK